ncbi:hypothetical protein GUITHDRAFT_89015 [Guillardia theta CCMP2712]|uniref:FH2 domain-containing protein n=2 Tax=Guillardia theta TaxID=55529 RepID=L1ITZ8_GUITC|nr:hypothetical protein GUITHDRAFT_89015 [Guillardia theta CCMP2712]EKX39718.1 hypothetical protein GUITHDRAFT_89015 [Guillardia theta CCMP2712]|eukprot:XP_005826698.1 hypothetical protein GUITHDRAFT_89015 [Guillardia theta CCMP2712]
MKASSSKDKKKAIQLLDLKRANNIAITLSRFKSSNAEIKNAILTLDEGLLSLEQLQMLLTLLPTPDEIRMLKSYKGEVEKLGPSEQFLHTMAKIPKVEARVQGFIFKQEFNARKSELKDKVTLVASAAKRVIESVKFKGILEITLALGNFMNSGHQLGNAQGFSIESVLMLSGIRSGSNKKITLMHYLAALTASKEPSLLDFSHDLRDCRDAANIPREALSLELNQLQQCCDELRDTLSDLTQPKQDKKEHDSSTSTFLQIMTHFHKTASGELGEVTEKMELLDKRFKALAKYFGEDPKSFKPNDFFKNVAVFCDEFEKSLEEIRQYQKEGSVGLEGLPMI